MKNSQPITLSAAILKEALHYDPLTGIFKWASPRSKVRVGNVAGFPREDGYIHIKLNGKSYLAHILAWLYMHEQMPKGEIDHINHSRSDNRIENLRDVSTKENSRNKKIYKSNKTGVVGVFHRKDTGKFNANICVNGKLKHLGTFVNQSDAIEARKAAEKEFGFHENHGAKQ